MAVKAHGQGMSCHKDMAGAEDFVLFVITKETTLPREKVRQIIVTGVVGTVGGDDGIRKMNIAPVFRSMGSTGGSDTMEQISL